jgi:hypothetical protein
MIIFNREEHPGPGSWPYISYLHVITSKDGIHWNNRSELLRFENKPISYHSLIQIDNTTYLVAYTTSFSLRKTLNHREGIMIDFFTFTTPKILHEPVQKVEMNKPINITAQIEDDVRVNFAKLYYKNVADSHYTCMDMKLMKGNQLNGTWTAKIPAQNKTGYVEYYIEAGDDILNNTEPYDVSNPYRIGIINPELPKIYHQTISEREIGKDIKLNATVYSELNVTNVTLNYRTDKNNNLSVVNMSLISGTRKNGVWIGTIPALRKECIVEYYIEATDGINLNKTDRYEITVRDPYKVHKLVGLVSIVLCISVAIGIVLWRRKKKRWYYYRWR